MPEVCAPAEAAQLRAEQKVGTCRIDFLLAGRDTIEVKNFPGAVLRDMPQLSGRSAEAAAAAGEADAEQSSRPQAPPSKVDISVAKPAWGICCAWGSRTCQNAVHAGLVVIFFAAL